LFRVSAQEQFLQQLNDSQIEKIKQQNIGKSQEKQVKTAIPGTSQGIKTSLVLKHAGATRLAGL